MRGCGGCSRPNPSVRTRQAVSPSPHALTSPRLSVHASTPIDSLASRVAICPRTKKGETAGKTDGKQAKLPKNPAGTTRNNSGMGRIAWNCHSKFHTARFLALPIYILNIDFFGDKLEYFQSLQRRLGPVGLPARDVDICWTRGTDAHGRLPTSRRGMTFVGYFTYPLAAKVLTFYAVRARPSPARDRP